MRSDWGAGAGERFTVADVGDDRERAEIVAASAGVRNLVELLVGEDGFDRRAVLNGVLNAWVHEVRDIARRDPGVLPAAAQALDLVRGAIVRVEGEV